MHVLGCCFFFNDMATTEIYTLSLHDALPIFAFAGTLALGRTFERERQSETLRALLLAPTARPAVYVGKLLGIDRKSTRLNSSHSQISYAVFCLKKKIPRLY